MKIQKKIMVTCFAFMSVPSFALAQEGEFARKPYFGVDLGYTKVKDQSKDIASGLVGAVGGSATVTQDTAAYVGRVFGGYKLTENIDLEIGYTSLSSIKANLVGVASSGVAYTGSFSVSVSGFDYAALIRPSLSSGYNNFYVRVGGTNYTTKGTGSVIGTTVVSNSTSGMGYQYGFGYDAELGQDIMYRLAFTRIDKIAGESGTYANVLSVGFYKGF